MVDTRRVRTFGAAVGIALAISVTGATASAQASVVRSPTDTHTTPAAASDGPRIAVGVPVGSVAVAVPAGVPTKFRTIAVLTKSQSTAVAIALRTGDEATISGLIPEPYASSLNVAGKGFAPLFEACGTDGLPGGCAFGFESSFGSMGFQVLSIGAL